MPSDCQCSACGACACETTVIKKQYSPKESADRIKELEKEVRKLEEENATLRRKASVSREQLLRKLRKALENE